MTDDIRNNSVACHYQFFSRHDGAGSGKFESLNVSRGVGDSDYIVEENRELIKSRMGVSRLVSSRQVHGDDIFILEQQLSGDIEVGSFDAIITSLPDCALMVQLADCQGVLLLDQVNLVIAAIHNGWRGSVVNIISKTIVLMQNHYGSDPKNIKAWIGPSLGPCCAEFVNYRQELPPAFLRFQVKPEYFDFWEITRMQLAEAGVQHESIEIEGTCTSCSRDYFSYRRARRNGDGITGRHCAVIALK